MGAEVREAAGMNAFASVGETAFDVTLLDIESREAGFQGNRSLEQFRHGLAKRLEAATNAQHSIVIRRRSAKALLIQLDDFTEAKAAQIECRQETADPPRLFCEGRRKARLD